MQASGKPKCVVYVDGYNWYHAIFRNRPEWKWLNIQSFFEYLRSREEVAAVKVFSAMVIHEPDACHRQETYFNAIKTLPKLKVKFGLFQPREVTCRGSCREKYFIQEEKKTDVNMAVEMISDAIDASCPDRMCVVSGDSDIEPVVEWISKNKPSVGITVYVPAMPADQSMRRLDSFKTKRLRGVDCEFLPIDNLKDHQLKDVICYAPGKFAVRPSIWCAGGEVQVY